MDNKLNEMMESAMNGIKRLVEVNNVIGEPIVAADGLMLVPVSKLSFGFGGAGGDGRGKKDDGFGGGSAAGVKIEPLGFMAVRNGEVKMINIVPQTQSGMEKILELVPQVMDKIDKLTASDD